MRVTIGQIEIPSRRPSLSATFFDRAFGWSSAETGEADYIRLHADRSDAPGVALAEPEILGASAPLVVLHVEGARLDQALSRIVDAGGAVDREPVAVGAHGQYATFRDPEGNLFGLWTTSKSES